MLEHLIGSMLRRVIQPYSRRKAGEDAFRIYQRAVSARAKGRLDEAESCYRVAIEFDPASPELYYNLGVLLQEVGEMSEAECLFKRALELRPDYQSVHSSFLCIGDYSMTMSREEIYSRHVRWAQRFADPLANPEKKTCSPGQSVRPLKVGYVSADFRRHAVGRFLEPVLRNHDSSRYEVVCYSNAEASDDMTDHLRQLVGCWRNVSAVSDQELAAIVLGDQIDILVDLSGHSLGNRLLAFARKPAPVQVSWLGYLNTTGMKAMDYRLTDVVSDPPGSERWYRERLLRLPHPQWCYVPEAGPIVAPAFPVNSRRPDDPIVFSCMTRFMKITDIAVESWMKILGGVPSARLKIVDVPDHERGRDLRRQFDDAGLGARVDTVPTLFGDAYWKAFDGVDVALDTFPYTGATTTCDCLWMGVPVVTLAGPCGAARSASSLLTALGLEELVATTAEDYVEIAIALGRDRPRLAALRTGLRDLMKGSPICDPILFTKNFERQLDIAWAGRCERRSEHG